MSQLPLDLTSDRVVVRARRTDPETSHEAAADFEQKQTKAQRSVTCVVRILQDHRRPMSDFEIRTVWPRFWGADKWSYTLPCKARHWAREAGLVKHDGFGLHQGRRVRRWAIGKDEDFLASQQKCPCCGRVMRPSTAKEEK